MNRSASLSIALLFGIATVLPAVAEDEMRSLDEQVQEVKTDVLGIARDLELLEERLLFPSNTQVSIFVEMGTDEGFRLDALSIEIDGVAVTSHIYTYKELEALQGGGVQRVYTGNVTSGPHELTVALNGKATNGDDFTSSKSFSFSKGVEPRLLGLSLAGKGGSASIELGDW